MKMRNLKLEMHCKGGGYPTTYEAEFAFAPIDIHFAPDLEGVTVRVIVDDDGNVRTKVNKQKETAQ